MDLSDAEEWVKKLGKESTYSQSEKRRLASNKARTVLGFYLGQDLAPYSLDLLKILRN